MAKIERKYMAHYLNVTPSSTATYFRLGKDLEELSVELSAQVDKKKNILGESSITLSSYEASSSVEPYYADEGDDLFWYLQDIVDARKVLDDVKTDAIEVHLWDETSTSGVYVAYKETVYIEVSSYGGDNTGYQIPFNVHYKGDRVKGKFNLAAKTFTPDAGTLGTLQIEVIGGGTSTTTEVSDVIGETTTANLKYKLGGSSLTVPAYGDSDSGYTALTIGTAITVTSSQTKIVVVESDGSGGIIASSAVTAVVTGS